MLCPKLKLEADGGPGALWAKGLLLLLLSPKALNEGAGLALVGDEALDEGRPLRDLILVVSVAAHTAGRAVESLTACWPSARQLLCVEDPWCYHDLQCPCRRNALRRLDRRPRALTWRMCESCVSGVSVRFGDSESRSTDVKS